MARPLIVVYVAALGGLLITAVKAQVNLDNVTGGCAPGGCSGHGACVDGKCVCDPWWSSNADFIVVEDCTLSLVAMYVMWGVTLLLSLHVLFSTAAVVAFRFENFLAQRKAVKGYSLRKNPGLVAVLLCFGLGVPSVMMMSILHFATPATRVAFDPFTTALFFTGKAGLYLGAVFLQGPLLAVALKGEHQFDSLVRFNNRFNLVVNFMACVVGGIPFVTLVNYQDNIPKQFEVIRAYYFCQAIVLFMQFSEGYVVKLRLNHVLGRVKGLAMSSDKTSSIISKVNAVQDTIIRQAFIQTIINILMGAVPFLLNKHAYFLPISWLAIPLIAKKIALQIELDKKGTKTIRERFRNLIKQTGSSSHQNDKVSSMTNNPASPMASNRIVAPSDNAIVSSVMNFESKNPVMVKPQLSQYGSSDGMEEILHGDDETHRAKFADFVRARFASDSLNFFDAVVDYEKGDSKSFKNKGNAIVKRFIVENAPEAIDLPHNVRQDLILAFKSHKYTSTTFAEAKRISFDLLRSNFYHKFAATVEQ